MEGRGGRARGGQWRRGVGGGGGGGGAQDAGVPGERRGRGRGGHHRGRGKRDHYRGRGRGGAEGPVRFFSNRDQEEQDDKENFEEEMPNFYSRRKLESNWDRYEETEKEEANDDIPISRGTDYHVLLSSAGDSFTQFRFSEEKDWEMDLLVVNQVTAPVELPSVGTLHKLDAKVVGGFKPPAAPCTGREPALGVPCPVKPVSGTGSFSQASTAVIDPENEEEELDILLGLQKPVTELSLSEPTTSNTADEESASPEKASAVKEKDEDVVDVDEAERSQQTAEELKPKSDSVKKEITEEDLEDWLDSMIS
ncbi:cell death regulator Aven isoform X2 [Astyanax mexicanus]|uniref:cell death regulator Aven isoform X2 n=1 Tax=Astyanax mexicanus TaxID=7994 RepID=UPI0020CB3C05|nr:cell death regulator Aven isoform X2 [Astyanax mexicanus]